MLLNKLIKAVKEEKEYEINVLPENFIKNILDTQDSIPQKSRAGTYSGYVHVSSLSGDFCARQYAIAQHEKLSLYESLTGGHKVTFAIGRAVEAHIRESIIEHHGRHNIFAKWVCSCVENPDEAPKGTYRVGLWKPAQCASCGQPLDTFAEPAIKDHDNGISGRADIIVYHNKTLHIVEIKSMKKDQWEELLAPLDSHIRQNIFYPPLIASLNLPVSPVVTFVYCTKDFKWGSPYKTFQVDTSEKQHADKREELLAEAKQVKDFVAGGPSPPRICKSEFGTMAKKCPVAFRCFQLYKDEIK